MSVLLVTAHIFICIFLIAMVLLQHGKAADIGATFGGGSQTVFGASGADNMLTKVTRTTAFMFMCTSLALAMQAKTSATGNTDELFANEKNLPMSSPTAKPNTTAGAKEKSENPKTDKQANTLPTNSTTSTPATTAKPMDTKANSEIPASAPKVSQTETSTNTSVTAPSAPPKQDG